MNPPLLSRLALDWSSALPSDGKDEEQSAVLDLIGATVQDHGLRFPEALLERIVAEALKGESVRRYLPDSRGQLQARQSVVEWYERRQYAVDAEQVLLTPGTSFGYFLAFRLLCNPGDEVLIPSPGYPLFEDLAAAAGVKLRYWHMTSKVNADGSTVWGIDPEEIAFQMTPRTRALVVVSPHNPTGHVLTHEDWEAIGRLCGERRLPLLVDEVFCEWLKPGELLPRPRETQGFPLILVLNGISKMLALPQWKLAWLAVLGTDGESKRRFLEGAAHLADAFLAVGELQQGMLPELLIQEEWMLRLGTEMGRRRAAVRGAFEPGALASEDAGAYLCLRIQQASRESEVVRSLRETHGVLVHPGAFYHLPGHLVMTCIHSGAGDSAILGALSAALR
ncbi:MAG: pyridoxal phosphate-dependent aminotransferase [Candidatus Sumerlaeia bacterium]|nr:pyridoxal phosphate-dependent aminotransferase [Candidatus Sumerlaeia bacterium]